MKWHIDEMACLWNAFVDEMPCWWNALLIWPADEMMWNQIHCWQNAMPAEWYVYRPLGKIMSLHKWQKCPELFRSERKILLRYWRVGTMTFSQNDRWVKWLSGQVTWHQIFVSLFFIEFVLSIPANGLDSKPLRDFFGATRSFCCDKDLIVRRKKIDLHNCH